MVTKNICKTHSFKNKHQMIDWEKFTALCDCGSNDHQHELIVEYDSTIDKIILTVYFEASTTNIYQQNKGFVGYLKNLFEQVKFRFGCLFKGRVKLQYEFVFADEQAIEDYLNVLQECLHTMKTTKQGFCRENTNDLSSSLNTRD